MNILYVCSFGLKYYSMAMVNIQYNKIKTGTFWNQVVSLNESDLSGQKYTYETFYWLNDGKLGDLRLKLKFNHKINVF